MQVYIKYNDSEDNTLLTIDGVSQVVPKGEITLPSATIKDTDVYTVTYDYNNGSNYY